MSELIITLLWALPFAASVVAILLPTSARNGAAWLAGSVAAIGFVLTAVAFPSLSGGGVLRVAIEWIPMAGLNLDFRPDGLAWLFCILITFIRLLGSLYVRNYMSPRDPVHRLYSLLLAFMGSMIGVVLSGNIIQLAIFWELTSLVSFLLIGYWYHRGEARDGARMALIVTGTGGLALFFAMLLVGHIVGSYQLDDVLASGSLIVEHELYPVTLVLFLVAAFTKSAQFPFQFWLPNAMTAPTPV